VVAILFGVLTLRQWQRTRYLSAAAGLVGTIQSAEFSRSIARIMALPEQAPAANVLADPTALAAFYGISHVFESLGVLVYHRLLPLHLVDHLTGGYVRASWRRVRPAVEEQRQTLGASFAEWFQWLAERMEEHPAPGKKDGAPVAFRGWRP
jgi:hypothetical protein